MLSAMSMDQLSVGSVVPHPGGALSPLAWAVSDDPTVLSEIKSRPGDTGASEGSNLSGNGTQVHPQPTNDPLDPLNWTKLRKHTILAIVMWL
jgi:hypothetical protein